MDGNNPIDQSNASSRLSRRKSGLKSRKIIKIIAGAIVLAAIGGGAFFLLQDPFKEETPSGVSILKEGEEPTLPSSTPTPTTIPLDRSEMSFMVLNGTGIGGEAGFLQGELEELGYENIEVGNAEDEDNQDTIVTFSSSVSESIKSEITSKLEDLYENVEVKTGDTGEADIEIVTGFRKGHTPTPTEKASTPTPTKSASTSPTVSSSPTPTESE